MGFAPVNEQMDVLRDGAVDLVSEEELAAKLERLLDRLAAGRPAGGASSASLRDRYVRAMELELAFFDAWAPRHRGLQVRRLVGA